MATEFYHLWNSEGERLSLLIQIVKEQFISALI